MNHVLAFDSVASKTKGRIEKLLLQSADQSGAMLDFANEEWSVEIGDIA